MATIIGAKPGKERVGAGTRLFHSLASYMMLAVTYLFAKPSQDRHVQQQNCQAADMRPCENQTPHGILHASSDTNGQAAGKQRASSGQAVDKGGAEDKGKAGPCAEQAICKGGAEDGAELTDTTYKNPPEQKVKHQKTRDKGRHASNEPELSPPSAGGAVSVRCSGIWWACCANCPTPRQSCEGGSPPCTVSCSSTPHHGLQS